MNVSDRVSEFSKHCKPLRLFMCKLRFWELEKIAIFAQKLDFLGDGSKLELGSVLQLHYCSFAAVDGRFAATTSPHQMLVLAIANRRLNQYRKLALC